MHRSKADELHPNQLTVPLDTAWGWPPSAKCWSACTRPAQPQWRWSAWLHLTGSWLWPTEILVWLLPSQSSTWQDDSQLHLLQALQFCTEELHPFSAPQDLVKILQLFPSMFFSLLVWMFHVSLPVTRGIAQYPPPKWSLPSLYIAFQIFHGTYNLQMILSKFCISLAGVINVAFQ